MLSGKTFVLPEQELSASLVLWVRTVTLDQELLRNRSEKARKTAGERGYI